MKTVLPFALPTRTFVWGLFLLLLVAMIPMSVAAQSKAWSKVDKMIKSDFPGVRHISTETLSDWMAEPDDGLIILDAREEKEFAVSHLKGAIRIDPDNPDLSALPVEARTQSVVVYCSVGYRSSRVANELQKEGFNSVYNLEGSIFRWANEGRPVFQGADSVNVVHPFDRTWGKMLNKELRSGR